MCTILLFCIRPIQPSLSFAFHTRKRVWLIISGETTRNFEETMLKKKKSDRVTLLLCILVHKYAISSALLNVSWLKYHLVLGKHRYNCHSLLIRISCLGLALTGQQSQFHHSYTHVGYLKSEVPSIFSKSRIPWQQRDCGTSSTI